MISFLQKACLAIIFFFLTTSLIAQTNLIKDGTFPSFTSSYWVFNYTGGTSAFGTISSGVYQCMIFTTGASSDIRLIQQNIPLNTGRMYRLSFDARAAAARTMDVELSKSAIPNTMYTSFSKVELGTVLKTYSMIFEMKNPTDIQSRLVFNVGDNQSTVYIDNVTLIELNAGADMGICSGETANLVATGGVNYLWSNGVSTASNPVSPNITSTYIVTVTDALSKVSIDTVVVFVDQKPVSTITPDTTICARTNFLLTASGGKSYLWSNGDTAASTFVSLESSGYNTVKVFNNKNCFIIDSVYLTVLPSPIADAGFDVTSLGSPVTLTATGNGSYLWNNSVTTATNIVNPVENTLFIVTVTGVNGCSSKDEVIVFSNSINLIKEGNFPSSSTTYWLYQFNGGVSGFGYISAGVYRCYIYSASVASNAQLIQQNIPLYTGKMYRLSFDASAASDRTMEVELSKALTPNILYTSFSTVSLSAITKTYSFDFTMKEATDLAARLAFNVGKTTQNVYIDNVSLVEINNFGQAGPDVTICVGKSVTNTAVGGVDYKWNNGVLTAENIISPLVNTTYTVTITNSFGITSSDEVVIYVKPTPIANAGFDQYIQYGETTIVSVATGDSYIWSNKSTSAINTVSPLETTVYIVTVTNIYGCSDIDTVTVFVKFLPKLLDTVSVSFPSGYYSTIFNLKAVAVSIGDTIMYTLDGSNPYTSPTSFMAVSPVTVVIDPTSFVKRATTPAVNFRAAIKKAGFQRGKILTRTYVFMSNVLTQIDPNGSWPNPPMLNSQSLDYDMDPTIVNSVAYKDSVDDALLSLPTYSITTDVANLFDASTGIFVNAAQDEYLWERPANIELFYNDGRTGFNLDAGIRLRGGYSTIGTNPKHAFRIFFRDEYGKKSLKYALFENEGTDEFAKFDLRTSQNYSWSYEGSQLNVMLRDVFCRDLQGKMTGFYTRSRFAHLYLDGMYWGLFQTQERGSKEFSESYLGGSKDDYDVVKVETQAMTYNIEATDGNTNAWQQVYNLCTSGFTSDVNYYTLQGLNSAGVRDSTLPILVDIDNLIDYMLNIFYTGNLDAPVTKFQSDDLPNNFYAIYNRTNKNEGFKFLVHDAEHTLLVGPTYVGIGINENRVNIGSIGAMTVASFSQFHPQWLHYKLCSNANYKMRFADHVYKNFFNNGALTPAMTTALFNKRANEIKTAIIAESARWGDAKREPAFSKVTWQTEVNNINTNFFPVRTGIVLQQIKNEKLYSTVLPPIFTVNDTEFKDYYIKTTSNKLIKLINPAHAGTMYYTIDGSDPRLDSNSYSLTAIVMSDSGNYETTNGCVLKARVFNLGVWSPLHELVIYVADDFNDLKITEIHYNPIAIDTIITSNDLEFVELKNTGKIPINLKGVQISNAITYKFTTDLILQPGGFVVLASKDSTFFVRYGVHATGEYIGHLSNGGETILATYYAQDTIFSITYSDNTPWPLSADGLGNSVVPVELDASGNLNLGTSWRSSYRSNGSPFADDLVTAVAIAAIIDIQAIVYPNPVKDVLYISAFTNTTDDLHITLYSTDGKQIMQTTHTALANEPNLITIPVNNFHLSAGIYVLRLQSNLGVITKRVVVN